MNDTTSNNTDVEPPGPMTGLHESDIHAQDAAAETPEPEEESGKLHPSDLEGTPAEIIRRLAGRELAPTNGWKRGEVVGAWMLRRAGEDKPHVRLMLASPNGSTPVQLFNEDARDYLA